MRVYKLKLAFEVFIFFFFFVLFEVAAEQVPLRKIREITLYRADVFFFFFFAPSSSLGRSGARWRGSVTPEPAMERKSEMFDLIFRCRKKNSVVFLFVCYGVFF